MPPKSNPKPCPKTIDVGPYRFDVQLDATAMAEQRLRSADNRDMVATVVVERSLIVVDPNQSADSTADSLLHETLHAIWKLCGLADRQPQAIAEGDILEEAVVAGLCSMLLDTLRRNPALVAYLVDRT